MQIFELFKNSQLVITLTFRTSYGGKYGKFYCTLHEIGRFCPLSRENTPVKNKIFGNIQIVYSFSLSTSASINIVHVYLH